MCKVITKPTPLAPGVWIREVKTYDSGLVHTRLKRVSPDITKAEMFDGDVFVVREGEQTDGTDKK